MLAWQMASTYLQQVLAIYANLSLCDVSLVVKGQVYSFSVGTVFLYACE